jgi:sortase A
MAAVHAAWIPLKAELAQVLLEHSWERQKAGEIFKPWPWADTHAIARLLVPRLEVQQIVLAGNSGRNLAFGPTALQGLEGGNPLQQDWIINGHRDTHFRFLQQLQRGDVLRLETAQGSREFAVENLEVIDSRVVDLVLEPGASRISLVTCYPFDAVTAGGPLRYVVTALPLEQRETNLNPPVLSSG